MPWLCKSVAKSSQRVAKHISNEFHKWPHYKANSCCVVSTPVSFLPFFNERTTHAADKAVIGTIQCSNLVYSQRVLSLVVVMLISIVRFKQQQNCNKFPDTVGWSLVLPVIRQNNCATLLWIQLTWMNTLLSIQIVRMTLTSNQGSCVCYFLRRTICAYTYQHQQLRLIIEYIGCHLNSIIINIT